MELTKEQEEIIDEFAEDIHCEVNLEIEYGYSVHIATYLLCNQGLIAHFFNDFNDSIEIPISEELVDRMESGL